MKYLVDNADMKISILTLTFEHMAWKSVGNTYSLGTTTVPVFELSANRDLNIKQLTLFHKPAVCPLNMWLETL